MTSSILNNIHLYQVIVVSVAAIMIYQGFENYLSRKSGQTFLKLLVRLIVWGGMMLVAIFPNFSNLLAKFIGLEGNINAVILSGFLLIFLMLFKLMSAIERLEQQLSEVTRKEALKKITENLSNN